MIVTLDRCLSGVLAWHNLDEDVGAVGVQDVDSCAHGGR